MSESVVYKDGRNLQAGWVTTDQIPLVADTYFDGMSLIYASAVAVTQTGTGDGTLTDVIAGADVPLDVYTLTFTAALIFDVTNAAGVVLAQGLVMADGAATTFTVEGITFTVTDGATAFVATDTLIATVTAGEYEYTAGNEIGAIYNGGDRVLALSGYGDCIMAGEINETGLVDDADATLTLTEDQRASYRNNGFYVKRV